LRHTNCIGMLLPVKYRIYGERPSGYEPDELPTAPPRDEVPIQLCARS